MSLILLLARTSLVKNDRNLKQQFIPNVTCLLMLMLTNDPPASESSPVRLEPFSARGLWTCKVRRQQGGQSHQCLKKMSSLSSATSSFTSLAFDFIKIIFTFSTLRSPLHILFFCPHLIILRLHVLPDRWPSLQHFISSDDLQRGRMFIKYYLRILESKNRNPFSVWRRNCNRSL